MAYTIKIRPEEHIHLSYVSTSAHHGLTRADGEQMVETLGRELSDLQDLLYAAATHSLLIVLQGRDTAGKDGMIRCLLQHANAQSCRVTSFKQPSEEELAHDFLWRVHHACPGKGGIAIFNRSHYEDVLVVRVHDLVPKAVWSRRYDQINAFESLLASSNTIIVKFWLHISKEEQKERLLARELETDKSWKLSLGDWKEREYWDDYTAAANEMLRRCSTAHAPWHVVPADRKWFRNLAVMDVIVNLLRPYKQTWYDALHERGVKALQEIKEYRAKQAEV